MNLFENPQGVEYWTAAEKKDTKIDKYVQFKKTPGDGEDDEDAGVDPDIDEEEEDELLFDNSERLERFAGGEDL
ncbi:hypothetical protein EC957_001757 [Mortierella hygrophila]|uniref:Uncharacterized protein n=1 Tax=Mortierella hygrophila TaxID=979708 RepID=A0A9P6F619_9FUNG|nr:hypothetical protein EC957_001757 [Mortierella hygrophila]